MDARFLYTGTAGICVGIALSLLWGMGPAFSVICLALAVFALLCSFFVSKPYMPLALLFAVFFTATMFGSVRGSVYLYGETKDALRQYIGASVRVEGTVVADPDRRNTALRVTVAVSKVDGAPSRGVLLASVPRNAPVSYGDSVRLYGKVSEPKSFTTDTGREFDYPNYLRAQNISVLMQRADVEEVVPGGFSIQKTLFSLKHAFERSLERVMVEPQSSLLEGVLLGEKSGISNDMTNMFVRSGLVHIVVLSGYNITVVSEAMFRVLAFLPRSMGFGVGGLSIVLFALMSGSGAATVRACIMALIAIAARYFHRQAVGLRMLAVAAGVMVLWNPVSLLYDPSFILSVLATFGLITLSPAVESRLPKFFDRVPSVKSIVASTAAVQVFVLPALLYETGVLSFVSLPANALALPVVPTAMFLGFIAGLLGLVHPTLAFIPALGADLALRWMILVADTSARLSFSAITVAAFPAWITIVVYVPLMFAVIRIYKTSSID